MPRLDNTFAIFKYITSASKSDLKRLEEVVLTRTVMPETVDKSVDRMPADSRRLRNSKHNRLENCHNELGDNHEEKKQ